MTSETISAELKSMTIKMNELCAIWKMNSDADGFWNDPSAKAHFDTLFNQFLSDALSCTSVEVTILVVRDAICIGKLASATDIVKLPIWPSLIGKLSPFLK